MNLEVLLRENPKTAIVIKQWLLDRLLEGLKDDKIPEDFKEYARKEGVSDDKVIGILQGSPRAMFDVFDSHKIYVEISHEITGFWWKIKDDKTFLRLGNDPHPTRKEADTEAIIESFKLLEDKL
jgi:hypothetical protein